MHRPGNATRGGGGVGAGARHAGHRAWRAGRERRAWLWLWAAVLVPACTSHTASPSGSAGTSTTAPVTSAAPSTPAAPGTTAEWTTYGGNPARTSADLAEPALQHAPVRAWTSPSLDGAVYGQPLVYGGQVLVATENDTVYALSSGTGALLWSVHLGDPVPSGVLPCGDISPVGVTSTMVVDPATGTLYASAETRPSGGVAHELVAVDLATHTVRFRRLLDQPGWSAPSQLQRAGLALDGSLVLVGFGDNYGDCGRYHGWLVGVPASGTGPLVAYEVPTARGGAIWAPPGPAVDASEDVFLATGNSSAGPRAAFDHGDAVIELSSRLAEQQYFAPSDWAQDNLADADLGSTSPVLLGDGRLFQVGKELTGYLLRTGKLGGVGGQAASLPLCNSRGATASVLPDLYVVCPDGGGIDQVVVGPGDSLRRGWSWRSPTGASSSPTFARGVLWVADPGAAILYGIDPSSGTTRWSLPLATGTLPPFAAASAGEGLVVVAGDRAVEAFR